MRKPHKTHLRKFEEQLLAVAERNDFTVKVSHFRRLHDQEISVKKLRRDAQDLAFDGVSPRGGKTVVELTTLGGRKIEGVALCAPADNFDAQEGRVLALSRALRDALGRETYRELLTAL